MASVFFFFSFDVWNGPMHQCDQSVCNLLSLWQAAEHVDGNQWHGNQSRTEEAEDPFADLREDTAATAPLTSASCDRAKSEAELAKYKSLTVPAPAVDPVAFWTQKAEQFPIMSLTARRLLCASTSSTQSERDLQFLWCLWSKL